VTSAWSELSRRKGRGRRTLSLISTSFSRDVGSRDFGAGFAAACRHEGGNRRHADDAGQTAGFARIARRLSVQSARSIGI
jgi:hypothetical protein